MIIFLHGAITICFLAAGLFFFRFWRDTLDRLFLLFALSFWLQALVRIALINVETEHRVYFYALRLLAYGLIIAAIVMKNIELKKPH
jgi:hypothetical protein